MRLKEHIGFWGYDKKTTATEKSLSDRKVTTTIEHQPGKTLWDWLKLLFQAIAAVAIPISIIVGLFQFNAQQAASTRTTLQQNAVIQAQVSDQQEEATLQSYLGDMSDLLLNHKLRNSNPGDEVRQVAQVQTLTTLRKLNAERNRIVLRFLQDAHLIGIQHAVINLSNANLSNDDLSGADLSGIDLSGADLSGAKLSDASLIGTILNGATLNGATLNGATLNGAFLNDADLSGADLSGIDLGGADLRYAKLSKAILNDGTLNGAIMNGANLSDTFLNGAILNGAILSDASLSDASLSDASLSDANLSGAILSGVRNLTQQQLDGVYSCKNAILSTGLICYRIQ